MSPALILAIAVRAAITADVPRDAGLGDGSRQHAVLDVLWTRYPDRYDVMPFVSYWRVGRPLYDVAI